MGGGCEKKEMDWISKLCNATIKSGAVPESRKTATILPKVKGRRLTVKSRGISLLSVKEKIIVIKFEGCTIKWTLESIPQWGKP